MSKQKWIEAISALEEMAKLGKDKSYIKDDLVPRLRSRQLDDRWVLEYYLSVKALIPLFEDGRLPPKYEPLKLEAPSRAFVAAMEGIPEFTKYLTPRRENTFLRN